MIGETDQPTDSVAHPVPTPTHADSTAVPAVTVAEVVAAADTGASPKEIGGRDGLDPVRYGDWEKNGRCIDF